MVVLAPEPQPSKDELRQRKWQWYRTIFTIVAGSLLIFMGVRRSEPAMMTVGGGLVGFSPAAKGPS